VLTGVEAEFNLHR